VKLLNLGLFLLFNLLTSVSAFAQITFGAEFTFTNNEIIARTQGVGQVINAATTIYRERMASAVRQACQECRFETLVNSYGVDTYKVIYPDGFYFVIATDPSVIEVQTKPATVEEIEKYQGRIQSHIFNAAKSVGLEPHNSTGGGHIHIGLASATQGSFLKTRNVIVDFFNHAEMAAGVLNADGWNSPPITMLPED